ncbi:MAG: hypothetical protein ACE37F_33395 [Nannocystaceae bacterium]|nr:hypothetical protein [bacterium]
MSAGLVRGVLALESSLIDRVASGRGLGKVLATATTVLALGCAAYGMAMGLWRSPLQSLSAGLKLPALFLATAALTAGLDVVLCGLLRARIRPAQALTASVLAMAILGSVLGSLAPVAAFVSTQASPPQGAASLPTSHWLLTAHVVVLGVAGIIAVSRLRGLLDALIPDTAIARRVLWAWMVTHGVVGAQMSWVLRPFVGNPTLPVRVLRSRPWEGSFFEAVFDMTVARMGPVGPLVIVMLLLGVVVVVASHLDPPIEAFEITPQHIALRRRGARAGFEVPLSSICDVSRESAGVRIHWIMPGRLERSTELLRLASQEEARAAFERIAWASGARRGYRAPS